jgi:NAD(P)H dehydrogenase (quinone)
MHVYVVFAHPSRNSFTGEVLKSFERGLKGAGHSVGIADLYAMDLQTDMDIAQYNCPAKLKGWFDRVLTHGYSCIRGGWGQRRKPVSIVKALLLCPAGHTVEDLERGGIARAMRTIMLDDRMPGLGVQEAAMEILGGMTNDDGTHRRRNLRRAYQLGKTFGPSHQQLSEPAHTCCG